MKINLLENWDLYCQVVPTTKIDSLENLKLLYENFQIYGSAWTEQSDWSVKAYTLQYREEGLVYQVSSEVSWCQVWNTVNLLNMSFCGSSR